MCSVISFQKSCSASDPFPTLLLRVGIFAHQCSSEKQSNKRRLERADRNLQSSRPDNTETLRCL